MQLANSPIQSDLSKYATLLTAIRSALTSHSKQAEQAIASVRDELKLFGKSGTTEAIREILANPAHLEKIAMRSYLHGNGFYKIILEDNNLFRLRLHIWRPESRAEENIHDHRWHFASTILSGHMESEIWEDAIPGGGELLDEYLYVGKTETEEAYVRHMGKSEVSLKQKDFHAPGDAYYMMSNVMHKIVYKGNQEISTLMCHAKDARRWARTITRKTDLPDVDHAYISVFELRKILESYLSSLAR